MAEQAQELTATNAGQPIVVVIEPATTDEVAVELAATEPTSVTLNITPAE